VLGVLLSACRVLAAELTPFLPDAAARIAAQCAGQELARGADSPPQGSRETARQGGSDSAPLPPATPLFARIVEED